MNKNGLHPEEQTYAVTYHDEESGENYEATLSFGGGRWARLSFKNNAPAALIEGQRIDLIKVQAESGQSYTLCECQYFGLALYINYIVEADIGTPEFDQITVRFHEVSEWFLRWQRIQGSVGEQLSWTNTSKPISVFVDAENERFALASEYYGSMRQSGEHRVIHEHVDFSFVTEGEKFGLRDLKSKTHELSCLLSILIAYPATVSEVRVRWGEGRRSKVHFATSARPERNFKDSGFWTKFFVQKPQLDTRWQTIFEHYYRSPYRKVCWTRLAGMQRYEGFWEYEALGYVSLLDKYVSIRSKGAARPAKVPPAATKLAEFRLLVDKSMPSVDGAELDKLVELASCAFASTPFAFAEKYKLAVSQTDSDVIKIIALSAVEFRQIKKIRDAIAHGDDPGLKEGDYTKVSGIVAKIKLLLTYWAFLDFGLSTSDFLQCLKTTHSELRFTVRLDDVHLARVTGTAAFFSVSQKNLDELKQPKGARVFGCFIREDDGSLSFSAQHTKMYKDWQHAPGRTAVVESASAIFGIDDSGARVVPHAYVESGTDRLELHHMWMIDRAAIAE